MMIRHLYSLSVILLAMGLIGTPRLAQAQLGESPITPGFWSYANRKSENEKKLINSDESILLGTAESKYSLGDGKTLRMTVTPKMITDTPFTNAPFDAYPVHCLDDVVWSILNDVGRSK